ncbi:RagB/SusD family nutrient uptake outer membrane protein [Fibrella aquatilis]|uniref:RagB/SusD family nutrient uptake outer membrane protein n=1 Tax=Fibrella aquatilis TaxID=2817059 RepID=A0A939K173_9BACT|nr:RagB/SusD family nutrient uptake outer membrane protein [Fibrella aquatilis]MBO0931975.1 RagB/SusD family nutrient uptake outer membrane protein [Fibrella aquatilis]
MKTSYINRLLVLVALSALFGSCKDDTDFFNAPNPNAVQKEVLYNNPKAVQTALYSLYREAYQPLTRGGKRRLDTYGPESSIYFDTFTDDGVNAWTSWYNVSAMENGNFSANNAPSQMANPWFFSYASLRSANELLENVGQLNDATLVASVTTETRFVRALYYFELWRWYGGVPIVTKTLTTDEANQVSRSTSAETLNFIVSELDAAAKDLPLTNQRGRATKGAALAFKTKALLHAGNFAAAAAAAKAVMDLGVYALHPDFNTLFMNKANQDKEYIYLVDHVAADGNGTGVLQMHMPPSAGGWGAGRPSQNLVDEYELTDGKSYTESPLYNEQDPYKNRDLRFYTTILFQGAPFRGSAFTVLPGTPNADGSGNIPTGYFVRKFASETETNFRKSPAQDYGDGSDLTEPLIRYADILLMYAEAQNEASGPDASVYTAVNQVRQRAKMPVLATGLTKDAMRAAIRHERRVELAFEESRFWDVRRWKQLLELSNKPVTGIKITQGTDGKLTFARIPNVRTRTMQERQYLAPIPQRDIDANKNLAQNPGW